MKKTKQPRKQGRRKPANAMIKQWARQAQKACELLSNDKPAPTKKVDVTS